MSSMFLACIVDNLLVYFKSSVTSFPPFGLVLSARLSRKASLLPAPITDAARSASFARIWRGVSVEVGMSK